MLFKDLRGKVIIFEGLPGVGKSTLLHDQHKKISTLYPCECYREETTQPLDLFRQAVISESLLDYEVNLFLQQYPDSRLSLEKWIHNNSYSIDDTFVIAYTQTDGYGDSINQFAAMLKCYDVGDGRSSLEEYLSYHKKIWRNFAKTIYNNQTVYLSEGSLFHNQLFDLIGFYNLSDCQLYSYYKELLSETDGIDLRVVYIGVDDTESLLRETCQLRTGWHSQLEKWMMFAPWAKKRELYGESGMVLLYNQIQRAHIMLQKKLGLRVETLIRY